MLVGVNPLLQPAFVALPLPASHWTPSSQVTITIWGSLEVGLEPWHKQSGSLQLSGVHATTGGGAGVGAGGGVGGVGAGAGVGAVSHLLQNIEAVHVLIAEGLYINARAEGLTTTSAGSLVVTNCSWHCTRHLSL
jgi:hypothetical protein